MSFICFCYWALMFISVVFSLAVILLWVAERISMIEKLIVLQLDVRTKWSMRLSDAEKKTMELKNRPLRGVGLNA